MTSNLGSDLILETENPETLRDSLSELLKQTFRPEFLNRIDETVIFNRLGRAEIGKIVNIQLARLAERLADRQITITLTGPALERIAQLGYDPMFGARPLKRAIQAELENPLAKLVIAGSIREGDTVTVDMAGDRLEFAVGG